MAPSSKRIRNLPVPIEVAGAEAAGKVPRHFIGVDFGQSNDYTAIVVLKYTPEYLAELKKPHDTASPYRDDWRDVYDEEAEQAELWASMAPATYEVYAAQRVRPDNYDEVVERIAAYLSTNKMKDTWLLAADRTGVGQPMIDWFRHNGVHDIHAVHVAGGEQEIKHYNKVGWLDYTSVPKKNLIYEALTLFEREQLIIPENVSYRDVLVRELTTYSGDRTQAGNPTFAPWREREHDDLLFALCLAVWVRNKGLIGWIDESLISDENLFGPIPDLPFGPLIDRDLFRIDDPMNPQDTF